MKKEDIEKKIAPMEERMTKKYLGNRIIDGVLGFKNTVGEVHVKDDSITYVFSLDEEREYSDRGIEMKDTCPDLIYSIGNILSYSSIIVKIGNLSLSEDKINEFSRLNDIYSPFLVRCILENCKEEDITILTVCSQKEVDNLRSRARKFLSRSTTVKLNGVRTPYKDLSEEDKVSANEIFDVRANSWTLGDYRQEGRTWAVNVNSIFGIYEIDHAICGNLN